MALFVQVDDVLWDMARPLEGDCSLQIFSFDSAEGRDTFWHSSAHILGEVRILLPMLFTLFWSATPPSSMGCFLSWSCFQAHQTLVHIGDSSSVPVVGRMHDCILLCGVFGGVQALEQEYGCDLCIGPCTTRGEGFYYDGFYGGLTLEEEQYKAIKAKAGWAVKQKQNFERIEVTREQAMKMFDKNPFKVRHQKPLAAVVDCQIEVPLALDIHYRVRSRSRCFESLTSLKQWSCPHMRMVIQQTSACPTSGSRGACFLRRLNPRFALPQIEIIRELPEDKTITVYRCGPLVDLCRGPHIPNTGAVKAFHISKVRSFAAFAVPHSDMQRLCVFPFPSGPLFEFSSVKGGSAVAAPGALLCSFIR